MPLCDQRQVIPSFVSFVAVLRIASGYIVVSPKDVEAPLGATVIFNCSSSIAGSDVQWNVHPVGKPMEVIYAYSKFNAPFVSRFTVQNGHNLHIASVTVNDAGTYECRDDYGKGEKKMAELIILESNPTCRSNNAIETVVEKNTCGLKVGLVTLKCTVQFQGKRAPTLEWKKEGEEKTITSGVSSEVRGNLLLHNLTIEGVSNLNGSSYNCLTAKAATTSASCNSGTVLITGQSSSPCGSNSCQSQVVVLVVIMIVLIIIFNGIAASVVWYLFIRPFTQKKIPKEQRGTNDESTYLLNKEQQATIANEVESPADQQRDATIMIGVESSVDPEQHVSNKNELGTSVDQQPLAITENESGTPTKQEFVALESKSDHSLNSPEVKELPDSEKKTNSEGSWSQCKITINAVTFVLLMTVPFCIGLIPLIIVRRRQLRNEKGELQKRENAEIQQLKATVEELKEHLSSQEKSLEDQLEKQQNAEIQLKAKVKELEQRPHPQEISNEDHDQKLHVQNADIQLKARVEELERRLYSEEKHPVKYSEKPELIRTIELEASSNKRKAINGLAILGKELFVQYEKSSEIEVYDSANCRFERIIDIPRIEVPFDLTAGKADKCLFVLGMGKQILGELDENKVKGNDENAKQNNMGNVQMEETESVVVRFDAGGNLFYPWPKPSGGVRGQLSTYGSNLVVCVHDKSEIKEFSRDGDLIHTIGMPLSAKIVHPFHAIKLTSVHYAVSHGNEAGIICIFDVDEAIKQEFGEYNVGRLSSGYKFNVPIHFIEDDEKSLLVADKINNQIVLFNWDLTYRRPLIALKNGEYPVRLCFNDSQNMLFVARNKGKKELRDGEVLVYKIK